MHGKSERALCAVLVCVSVGGCGAEERDANPSGPVVDLAFAKSGQRLKAWSFVGDGIELFDTFHDDQLDADCELVPTSERDRYVCFPKVVADVVYLDAACTQPAARSGPPATIAPGQWVSAPISGAAATCTGGPPPKRVGYRVGEPLFVGGVEALSRPLPSVFALVDSRCQPTTLQFALLPADLLRLERQDDSVFVSGTSSVRPATAGFAVRRVTADDGAELTVDVLGPGGDPCLVQSDGRCVPGPVETPPIFGTGDYLDPNCTAPAFAWRDSNPCQEPRFGVETVAGQVHVYELEKASVLFAETAVLDPATGQAVLDAQGRPQVSCKPDDGGAAYAAGKDVTSSFALAGRTEAALGALRLVQHRSPSVSSTASAAPHIVFEAGGVFVDEKGQSCRTRTTPFKTLECDVTGPEIFESGFWKDAACEDRLYDFLGPHSPASGGPDVSALREVGSFGEVSRTWLSFKPYAGPVYSPINGACSPMGETALLLEVDSRVMLPELPLVER